MKIKQVLKRVDAFLLRSSATLMALLSAALLIAAANEWKPSAKKSVTIDAKTEARRTDAIALAKYCFALKGAVATITEGLDGDIEMVECKMRIEK